MASEMKIMMGMMMALMMFAVIQPLLAQAQPTYCCPLCENVCFYSYDALYEHFISAHPAEPIDIIWS